MNYKEWMNAVNKEVLKLTENEIDVHSLVDWLSRDCYDQGMTPYDGAIEALENDEIGAMLLMELEEV